jgi:flagellin-specific chaperone FliS
MKKTNKVKAPKGFNKMFNELHAKLENDVKEVDKILDKIYEYAFMEIHEMHDSTPIEAIEMALEFWKKKNKIKKH